MEEPLIIQAGSLCLELNQFVVLDAQAQFLSPANLKAKTLTAAHHTLAGLGPALVFAGHTEGRWVWLGNPIGKESQAGWGRGEATMPRPYLSSGTTSKQRQKFLKKME